MLGMLQGSVWWAAKHGKEVESDEPADQQLQLLFFGESKLTAQRAANSASQSLQLGGWKWTKGYFGS